MNPHQNLHYTQKVLKIPEGELKLDYIQLETWTKNYPELEAWSDIRVRCLDIWQATERLLRHLATHNQLSFPAQSTFGHSLKLLSSDPRFAGNKHFAALVRKMKERLILETRNAVVHGSVMPKLQAVHEALDCYREFLLFSTWKTKPHKFHQPAAHQAARPGPPAFNPQTPAPYMAQPPPTGPPLDFLHNPAASARFDPASQQLTGQFSNLSLQSKLPAPQYPQPYQVPTQPKASQLLPPMPPQQFQYPPPQQAPPHSNPPPRAPYQPIAQQPFVSPFAPPPHQQIHPVQQQHPVPNPNLRQFVAPLISGLTVLLEAILKNVASDIVQDSLTEILITFTALISLAPEPRAAALSTEASMLNAAVREALDSRQKPAFLEAYTRLANRIQTIKAQVSTL